MVNMDFNAEQNILALRFGLLGRNPGKSSLLGEGAITKKTQKTPLQGLEMGLGKAKEVFG